MSVFDWVEMGIADHGKELPGFKGSFGVTIGDVLNGTFGARHNHTFGPNIQLTCDLEDILLGPLDTYLPLVSALLGGIGGDCKFVYGTGFTGVYVGPNFKVQRAPAKGKTSENRIAHKYDNNGTETAEIDLAMSIVVAALSILMCAVAMALELYIHFKYPKFGSTDPTDQEDIERYGTTPELCKICCYTIVGRLMALLKMAEEKGTWANLISSLGAQLKFLGVCSGILIAACIPLYGWYALMMTQETWGLKNVVKDAAKALED